MRKGASGKDGLNKAGLGKVGSGKDTENLWDGLAKKEGGSLSDRLSMLYQENIEHILDEILEGLPTSRPKSKMTILDAGCGTGRFTRFFSTRARKVVGIDPSPVSINAAKRRLRADAKKISKDNLNDISYLKGSLTCLPFKDNTFDVCFTSLVLQHILPEKDFRKACDELRRVTRPGGTIILLEIVKKSEKKRDGYIAIRNMSEYRDAMRPCRLVRQHGVRFPYFTFGTIVMLKRLLVKGQKGDVRDTYSLYDRIGRSKSRGILSSAILASHYAAWPLSKLSSAVPGLSPERIMVFRVPGNKDMS